MGSARSTPPRAARRARPRSGGRRSGRRAFRHASQRCAKTSFIASGSAAARSRARCRPWGGRCRPSGKAPAATIRSMPRLVASTGSSPAMISPETRPRPSFADGVLHRLEEALLSERLRPFRGRAARRPRDPRTRSRRRSGRRPRRSARRTRENFRRGHRHALHADEPADPLPQRFHEGLALPQAVNRLEPVHVLEVIAGVQVREDRAGLRLRARARPRRRRRRSCGTARRRPGSCPSCRTCTRATAWRPSRGRRWKRRCRGSCPAGRRCGSSPRPRRSSASTRPAPAAASTS